ncbi:hypothetical protein I4U23_013847 [Adineta vaga]|nr:hypothetical protein I4U23_013847 [Adineta vaga]
MDSYTFQNMSLATNSIFNFTIQTLGSCLCLKSYTFDRIYSMMNSENIKIILTFNTLRGLSFFSNTFYNISLNNAKNQLKINSDNPTNDPNPIINFARDTFSSMNSGLITLNLSSTTIVRFENNSLRLDSLLHNIYLRDIVLIDLSSLNSNQIKTDMNIHFNHIRYVKWFKSIENNLANQRSSIQFHFKHLSSGSCLIYEAPRTIPWLFPNSNTTLCTCPLLFAYKLGQLDGQLIPCIRSLSGHETARKMDECHFTQKEHICHSTLQSLTDLNTNSTNPSSITNYHEIDNALIQQVYDINYLSCSYNYSSYPSSTYFVRTRVFNNLGLVIGIILGIFIILLILVMALLNGLQYKMREYDETWTWRRNMSWTSLRRTISQTSLRRSRRDLRTINGNVTTSKSENQIDRLRYDQADSDEHDLENDFLPGQCLHTSIHDNLKKANPL